MPPTPRRIEPGPGQESVWDYPRPPRVEGCGRRLRVVFSGCVVAETTRALRVLVRLATFFTRTHHTTLCEWKGVAHHYTIAVAGRTAENAAWSYPAPAAGYETIADHVAFYPARVDACYVDGERVRAQQGDFYGGWITRDVSGPFKGGPGTQGW